MIASSSWPLLFRFRYALIGVLAFLLYAQSISFDYTLDDAIVIYDNDFTQQGLAGIPDLFSYDTFRGFFKEEGKEKLVAGGRYRPLSLALFAMEYQLVGPNPWLSHLINVILYALLGLLILSFLESHIFQHPELKYLSLLCALVFVLHPIHTEVVANIKGRDEILSLLFGLLALRSLFNHQAIGALLWMTLAMFSKEMAATWVPIGILSFWILKNHTLGTSIRKSWPLWAGFAIYGAVRLMVLGWPTTSEPIMEMMNNPFIKLDGQEYELFTPMEKWSSIFYSLWKYLILLIFPYPLTHDYYPRSIPVVSLSHIYVILSIISHVLLLAMTFVFRKKWPIASWAAGFYLLSLVLISNILFPIGTHMGERFVFMASLGFWVGLTWKSHHFLGPRWTTILLLSISVCYTGLTLWRLPVWKNDYTLFTHDVQTSTESAKALNAAGGSLVDECIRQGGEGCDSKKLDQAVGYLTKATEIHPNYKNAHFILGNAFFLQKEYEKAVSSFHSALKIDPDIKNGRKNLKLAYIKGAKHFGEKEGNAQKALTFLKQAKQAGFDDREIWRLEGIAYGILKQPDEAMRLFEKILAVDPNDAETVKNIGITHLQMGNQVEGMNWIKRAEELEKND